jgi:trehalose 6-phosphate phosphatase
MPHGGSPCFSRTGNNFMTRPLYDQAQQVFQSIKETATIVLFLDFDGTLVPFANTPQDVILSRKVRALLKKLADHSRCRLIIITGRTRGEIKDFIDLKGVTYAAVHGMYIEFSSGEIFQWKDHAQAKGALKEIRDKAQDILSREPGVLIEDKGLTVALHYRMVPQQRKTTVIEQFTNIVDRANSKHVLHKLKGSDVLEVRPNGWNKGKAVETILHRMDATTDFLTIYVGDDTTDEDAFRVLSDKGITIVVRNGIERTTHATYFLETPADVHCFLGDLLHFLNIGRSTQTTYLHREC